jgi:hypothetical protein
MKSDQEFEDTHAIATSSIKVLNLIKEQAQSLGCLQGEVSRALMPFGVETSAGDQSMAQKPDEAGQELLNKINDVSVCDKMRDDLLKMR